MRISYNWLKEYRLKESIQQRNSVLHRFEILMIPVVNPLSRQKVEQGSTRSIWEDGGTQREEVEAIHVREKVRIENKLQRDKPR